MLPNSSDLSEGMSSHHSLRMKTLFNSNDPEKNMDISSLTLPNASISSAALFSIAHTL